MASSAGRIRRSVVTDGEPTAIGGLEAALAEHRAQLVRFFTSRTGDGGEAEDVVQEIWLRVSAADTGPVGDPLAYLYRVGLNIVVDRVRSRQRRARRESDWMDVSVQRIAGGDAIDERPSPLAELERQQRAQALAAAIAALPPGAGRVFRRLKLDGLSHAEVAAELGISRSAVEKHVAVALRHLTQAMQS